MAKPDMAEKIRRVDELLSQGLPLYKACAQVKTSVKVYRREKGQKPRYRRKSNAQVFTLPDNAQGSSMSLRVSGSPKQLAEFLQSFRRGNE